MSKTMKKFLNITVMTTCVLLALCATAMAEIVSGNVFYVDTVEDIQVMFQWDGSQPEVVLLSPDGEQVDVFADTENVRVSDGVALYVLRDATRGQWQMICDKKDSTKVTVTTSDYSEPIWIEAFQIDQIAGETATVSFGVTAPDSGTYRYEISAILGDDTTVAKLLSSGNGSGEAVTKSISLQNLASYTGYRLMLEVSMTVGDLTVTDWALSDSFDFVNSKEAAAPDLDDFQIVVNAQNQTVAVSRPSTADTYLIRYFSDVSTQEYVETFSGSSLYGYENEATTVTIGVRKEGSNGYSGELVYEIDLTKGVLFQYDNPGDLATNVEQFPVHVTNGDGLDAWVTCNDQSVEINLQAETVYYTLENGANTIGLQVIDGAGIIWDMSDTIQFDGVAPMLRLFEDYTNWTTSAETLILVGQSEVGATVMVNGETVTLDDIGNFSTSVVLANGDNQLTLVATDSAGNKTTYSPVVTKTSAMTSMMDKTTWYSWFPLILGGVGALALAIWGSVALFQKKKTKGDGAK